MSILILPWLVSYLELIGICSSGQMSDSEDSCEYCPAMQKEYAHKCLIHAPCVNNNQYLPSKCSTCQENFEKSDEIVPFHENEFSLKIVNLVEKIMMTIGEYLGDEACLMPPEELKKIR